MHTLIYKFITWTRTCICKINIHKNIIIIHIYLKMYTHIQIYTYMHMIIHSHKNIYMY